MVGAELMTTRDTFRLLICYQYSNKRSDEEMLLSKDPSRAILIISIRENLGDKLKYLHYLAHFRPTGFST